MKTLALSKPEKINSAFLIIFRTTSESTEYNQLENIAIKKFPGFQYTSKFVIAYVF